MGEEGDCDEHVLHKKMGLLPPFCFVEYELKACLEDYPVMVPRAVSQQISLVCNKIWEME